MLTKDASVVSKPFPHCMAMSTAIVRLTSVGIMWPLSSNTGTVSVYSPLPESRITSPTGSSGRKKLQNSEIPPLCKKDSEVLDLPRLSLTINSKPGTKYEVWRALA